jgi:hypothetical protein
MESRPAPAFLAGKERAPADPGALLRQFQTRKGWHFLNSNAHNEAMVRGLRGSRTCPAEYEAAMRPGGACGIAHEGRTPCLIPVIGTFDHG